MKILFRFLLIYFILFFPSSCTKIVYISRQVEPEIILPNENHILVFVNLFDYTSTGNVKSKEKKSYHDGVQGLLDGMASFSNDSIYTFLLGDSLKKGIDQHLLTTLLPLDTIGAICARNGANLLLALDSLTIFFKLESDTLKDAFGIISTEKNLYLNSNFFVSLYNSAGELIDRSELDQSILYISRPAFSGILTIQPSIGRVREEVRWLGYQAGLDYVTKFYPSIIQEKKQLFTGNPFKESNKYIFARDWKKAIELLEELAKNKDTDIARKAQHNLEIAKEASEVSDK